MGYVSVGDRLKVVYASRNPPDSRILKIEQITVYLSDDEQIINVNINGVDELNKNMGITVKSQLRGDISVHHIHSDWYYKTKVGSIVEKRGRRGMVVSKNPSKGSTSVLWCDDDGVPSGIPIEYPDLKDFEVVGEVNAKN